MSFPQKSKFLKRPIGWEDLGNARARHAVENGETIRYTEVHPFCRSAVHIGKEDGVLFKFCPRCMCKTENNPLS